MRYPFALVTTPTPSPGAGETETISVFPTLVVVIMAALFAAGIVALLRGRDSGDSGGGWGV